MKNQEQSLTDKSVKSGAWVAKDQPVVKPWFSNQFTPAPVAGTTFYGRQNDQALLYQKIIQAYQDKTVAFIQVEGEGGVGKTSLLKKVLKQSKVDYCFQWYGKHDYRIEKIPYYGLKQAFHHWMEFLLTLHDQEFEKLKSAVRHAIGEQGEVLTSVFEELELLIGKKAKPEYSPTKQDAQQTRQQFTYFFQKFLASLAECGYYTILFLDDLQWADRATLDLLHDLVNSYEISHFLIIGANRPLGTGLEEIKLQQLLLNEKVFKFEVKPLDRAAIRCFIPSQWNLKEEEFLAFEEYLMQESEGNPFFAKEIIDYIESEQMVTQDAESASVLHWEQLPKLRQNVNAINLVQHKLVSLSVLGKDLIMTASSLGFYFSYQILSDILHIHEQDFENCIRELEEQHFIFRQGDQCFFIHDNIHAAAYSMLGRRKTETHFTIANYLKGLTKMNELHPLFFEMVNHFNLSREKITGTQLKLELAILNHLAGQLAKRKSAFDRALDYFNTCEGLLSGQNPLQQKEFVDTWIKISKTYTSDNFHHFYIANLLGMAEAQFLVHEYEQSLQTLQRVLELDQDRFIHLKAYIIQMKICIACINNQDLPHMLLNGLQITEHVLQQYHITLPQDEDEFKKRVAGLYEKVKSELNNYNYDQIGPDDLNQNKEYVDLVQFMVHALPLMFFKDVFKAKYLALAGLRFCLQNGLAPGTPALFASGVWTIFSLDKDYDMGLRLGEIAMKLIKKDPFKVVAQQVYHLCTLNFYNWKHHYRESASVLYEATELSLERGDYNYAVFCSANARLLQLFMGMNLKEHPYAHFNRKLQKLEIHFMNRNNVVFVVYLNGQKPGFETGRFFFPKSLIKEAEYNANCRYHYYHVKEKLYFLSGQHYKSYLAGKKCERIYQLYEAFQVGVEHNFFYCLNLLQLAHQDSAFKEKFFPDIKERWLDLHRLSAFGSGNYLHKKWLLEAEIARCEENHIRAVQLYDRAIAEGIKTGFIHIAAIAAELAGNYMLYLQRNRLAVPYFKEAYKYYQQWGAEGKLRWMEIQYPVIFNDDILHIQKEKEIYQQTGSSLSDITTVYQTVMALSKELTINGVVATLLRITMMHVKADKGVFLLKEKQGWRHVAERNNEGIRFYSDVLKAQSGSVPEKLINYVIRKKEKVWVIQPAQDKIFGEPYFVQHKTCAAGVVPVFYHDELIALVYLEKTIQGCTLDQDQLQVFDTLATQAGISLTNALMYEDLQRLNQELQRQEQRRVEAIIETQEKERKRVAEELHDNLGQMLSLVKLNFSRLEDHVAEEKDLYTQTSRILDESCNELRKIAHNIMPPDFEKRTLVEIIEAFLRKYVSASGLAFKFDHYQVPNNIPVAVKFNLYRVTQEIVNNILKHAQAHTITLQLIGNDEGIDMMVEDDGKGFDINFNTGGIGLQNISSRINLLKGTVEVDSSLQRGTIYNIHLPLS